MNLINVGTTLLPQVANMVSCRQGFTDSQKGKIQCSISPADREQTYQEYVQERLEVFLRS